MVVRETVQQGDILKIEKIRMPVLVTSKDFFNQSGEIIGCPVYESGSVGALHLVIRGNQIRGIVHCEKLALLDLNVRRYVCVDHIHMEDIIDITDAIQGIFDYVG